VHPAVGVGLAIDAHRLLSSVHRGRRCFTPSSLAGIRCAEDALSVAPFTVLIQRVCRLVSRRRGNSAPYPGVRLPCLRNEPFMPRLATANHTLRCERPRERECRVS
jgi:hypothetical protein